MKETDEQLWNRIVANVELAEDKLARPECLTSESIHFLDKVLTNALCAVNELECRSRGVGSKD